MKIKILSQEYAKLNKDKQRQVSTAINKLKKLLIQCDICEFRINNPLIHDSYGSFYVYKFVGMNCSIRLLYKYSNDILEIHMFHFKKGDRDNSKYIEKFENYVENYDKE